MSRGVGDKRKRWSQVFLHHQRTQQFILRLS